MIIAKLYGPLEVTVFNVTLVAAKQASALLTSATPVLLPGLCELYALNEQSRLTALFNKIMPSLIVMNLIVFFSVSLLTEPFVGVWVGQGKFGGVALVVLFMGWAFLVATIHPLLIFMRAEGNLKGLLFWAYPEAVLVVILSVIFGSLHGLAGIALGLLLSHLMTTQHYLWRWAKRKLDCGIGEIVRLSWRRCTVAAVVYLIVAGIDSFSGFDSSSLETLIFRGTLCTVSGLLCFWFLAVDKGGRSGLLAKLSVAFRRGAV
jgi:O-antigen/teichoic acid export membrane protein